MTNNIFQKYAEIISERSKADPEKSYTAQLCSQGVERIAQKVGEEAVETVIAAMKHDKQELVAESVDLIFHLMVLWHKQHISPDEITDEFERRAGISGIDEKKARNTKHKP